MEGLLWCLYYCCSIAAAAASMPLREHGVLCLGGSFHICCIALLCTAPTVSVCACVSQTVCVAVGCLQNKSTAAWVAQLRSPDPRAQAAAASALRNVAQFAVNTGGSLKQGQLIDCIVSAGGMVALTEWLFTACARPLPWQQLSAMCHVLVLLKMLLQTRQQHRAELAATCTHWCQQYAADFG